MPPSHGSGEFGYDKCFQESRCVLVPLYSYKVDSCKRLGTSVYDYVYAKYSWSLFCYNTLSFQKETIYLDFIEILLYFI